jgi:hypothetical protein
MNLILRRLGLKVKMFTARRNWKRAGCEPAPGSSLNFSEAMRTVFCPSNRDLMAQGGKCLIVPHPFFGDLPRAAAGLTAAGAPL